MLHPQKQPRILRSTQDDRGGFECLGAGEDARTTAGLETGVTLRSDSQGFDFIVLGWKLVEETLKERQAGPQGPRPV